MSTNFGNIDAFRTANYTPGSIHTLPDVDGHKYRWKVIGKGTPMPGSYYVTYLNGDIVMTAIKAVPMRKVLVKKVR